MKNNILLTTASLQLLFFCLYLELCKKILFIIRRAVTVQSCGTNQPRGWLSQRGTCLPKLSCSVPGGPGQTACAWKCHVDTSYQVIWELPKYLMYIVNIIKSAFQICSVKLRTKLLFFLVRLYESSVLWS